MGLGPADGLCLRRPGLLTLAACTLQGLVSGPGEQTEQKTGAGPTGRLGSVFAPCTGGDGAVQHRLRCKVALLRFPLDAYEEDDSLVRALSDESNYLGCGASLSCVFSDTSRRGNSSSGPRQTFLLPAMQAVAAGQVLGRRGENSSVLGNMPAMKALLHRAVRGLLFRLLHGTTELQQVFFELSPESLQCCDCGADIKQAGQQRVTFPSGGTEEDFAYLAGLQDSIGYFYSFIKF